LQHVARLIEAVQCPRLAGAWRAWWAFKHPGQASVNDLTVDRAPGLAESLPMNSS
jgi:hypothetical protein